MIDEKHLEKLWLHFLHSFALSDHLGDAAEDVRMFAERARLPIPDANAEMNPDSDDPEESWLAWGKEQGVDSGIHSDEAREAARLLELSHTDKAT